LFPLVFVPFPELGAPKVGPRFPLGAENETIVQNLSLHAPYLSPAWNGEVRMYYIGFFSQLVGRRGAARHKKGGLDSRVQGFKWLFSEDFISALSSFPIA
jgi:hypothetical protein